MLYDHFRGIYAAPMDAPEPQKYAHETVDGAESKTEAAKYPLDLQKFETGERSSEASVVVEELFFPALFNSFADSFVVFSPIIFIQVGGFYISWRICIRIIEKTAIEPSGSASPSPDKGGQ